MNIKIIIFTFAIVSSLGLAHSALPHGFEHHGHAAPPAQPQHQPDLAEVADEEPLTDLRASVDAIGVLIEVGNREAVHEEVETAETAIKALQEQAELDGDRKRRLEAALNQLFDQLDRLHTAFDNRDTGRTRIEFKKLQGALTLVENALK